MLSLNSYHAFLFDVDKTLTNSSKQITTHTRESVRKLVEQGKKVGVCTGRQFVTLQSTLQEIFPSDSLHICAGGAQIIDTKGNVHFEKTITEETARAIVDLANRYGCRAVLQQGNILYGNEKALAHTSTSTLSGAHQITKLPIESIPVWSIPIIVVVGISDALIDELSKLPIHYKRMVNYVGEDYVDITAQGVSKSSGIEEWCRLTETKPEEIVGFGDSENDLEFLQTVGYGVAMGNAVQALKDIADEVTLDCDHDGVAAWIEQHKE